MKTKIIIIVVIVIILTAVTIITVKAFKKSNDKLTINANSEIKPKELTYTETEYLSMANRIKEALDDLWVHETTVLEVLKKLKNKSDWVKLVSAFGVQEISMNWSTSIRKGNLVEWINDRMDVGEVRQVSSILSKIGVTF